MFTPDILLPGPTPVPVAIQQAMLTPMSDHRGSAFTPVLERVRHRLATLFEVGPSGGIAVLPASGTGALEATVQNFFQKGDAVLSVSTGAFGNRFRDVAQAHGLVVDPYTVPWGQAFDPAPVVSRIRQHQYRGILLTHNETSTGVINPIERLTAQMVSIPPAYRPLIVVDSISGVPAIPLPMQTWGVDVALAASQKGFMCPPGLALIAASGNGLKHLQQDRPHRFYFDLGPYFEDKLPYTPATSLIYGLDKSLELLAAEGSARRYQRHRLLGQMTRSFGHAVGWNPFVEEIVASPTVTSLGVPAGSSPTRVRARIAALGLQVAGGMGPWHDTAIRIGHVGAITPATLFAGLSIVAHVTPHPSRGLEAAWQVWHEDLDKEEPYDA